MKSENFIYDIRVFSKVLDSFIGRYYSKENKPFAPNPLLSTIDQVSAENRLFTPYMQLYALSSLTSSLLSVSSIKHLVTQIEDAYSTSIDELFKTNSNKKVAIIMAGNIPAVGFADLFVTLCCGYRVYVKLSSKDSILIPFLYKLLESSVAQFKDKVTFFKDDFSEEINPIFYKEVSSLIFSGSDTTKKIIEKKFENIPILARGSRFSYGVVNKDFPKLPKKERLEILESLTLDTFLYYGLGCRSISYLFLPQEFDIDEFIEVANNKFGKTFKDTQPYFNSYLRSKALSLICGEKSKFIDGEFFLLKKTEEIFPPLGTIYYSLYSSNDEINEFNRLHKEQIQKKYTNFGKGQMPTITDWQDGISTVTFLAKNRK